MGNENMAVTVLFIKEFIKQLKEKISDDYISLNILSTADGTVLMHDSKDPSIDNTGSGSYQFGIMKSVAMGVKKMGRETDRNQEVIDITITYEGQKHILALSKTRKFMIHLILESSANTALVMKHMDKTATDLIQKYAGEVGAENVKKVDITNY